MLQDLTRDSKGENLRSVALPTPRKASAVPYWKLCGLSTQTSIFSTSFRMWLNGRKAFYRHCSPRSISFKDTAIVRNFYSKKFYPWCRNQRSFLKICRRLDGNLHMIVLLIIERCTTCSQVYQQTKYYWSFSLLLSCESWFKSCLIHRSWGLNHNFKSFDREKGGLILMIISW